MAGRKTFLLDTSVLLYDKTSIHSFPGNDVIIPLKVLDELDRFKERSGLLGESARYVNRYLDDLRGKGRLDQAVRIGESDQTIRVEIKSEQDVKIPMGLDPQSGDNIIIGTALYLTQIEVEQPLMVVTKDINLRVKCDALGIHAEDYYKDHIDIDKTAYGGQLNIDLDKETIDEFFLEGVTTTDIVAKPNQMIVGTNGQQSMLGVFNEGKIKKCPYAMASILSNVVPRNKEQEFALWLLTSPDVPLVSITGIAGSGKTFLTLMAGLSGLYDKKYERIIFTRSIQPVGRDIGFLPGDMNEKMQPWLAPMMDNLRVAFKDTSYFNMMREKGEIEIAPMSYIRGRTFNDSFVIVDEAQNATIHELKTIITRVGKGSKIILLGDTDQVDTPYIDSRSNGLTITIEKFKDHDLAGHIHMPKGQRSDLATAASTIL